MNNLSNKIVFITGASSGIGKACAELFAKERASLILAARRIGKIKNLAKKLEKEYRIKTKCIKLDVRDYDRVEKSISSLEKNWKKTILLDKLFILCNDY
jgi:3-hydroxy acid dehydrogenase/malonic semialdehyde reductase